ncbi:hypothetical protein TNCV_3291861 [Trichonephila clavipes]|nr:hypothetical protein TNCV_3291861 [Trichonephila clavipes]
MAESPSGSVSRFHTTGESTVRAIKKNEAVIRKSVISGTKLSTKFASYTREKERKEPFQFELRNKFKEGFLHDNIDELPVDDALSDNDIIDVTLVLTVDGVVGLEGRATQNENEVCENPWPLPQISIAETVSFDDEGDLEPLRKRCKPLSDSDND